MLSSKIILPTHIHRSRGTTVTIRVYIDHNLIKYWTEASLSWYLHTLGTQQLLFCRPLLIRRDERLA